MKHDIRSLIYSDHGWLWRQVWLSVILRWIRLQLRVVQTRRGLKCDRNVTWTRSVTWWSPGCVWGRLRLPEGKHASPQKGKGYLHKHWGTKYLDTLKRNCNDVKKILNSESLEKKKLLSSPEEVSLDPLYEPVSSRNPAHRGVQCGPADDFAIVRIAKRHTLYFYKSSCYS